MPASAAPAWAEIDLAAIAHNVRALRRLLPAGCECIAVVKANAYGHGLVPVARTALAAGAARLAVGGLAEGEALRAAGVTAPILVVGPTLPEQARALVDAGLEPSVATPELAAALADAARRPLPVQVEVDTGMHRHGVPAADAAAFVRRLQIGGIYTHFWPTGAGAGPALRAQWRTFAAILRALDDLRPGPLRHACNTLATLLLPAAHLDAVRLGGGIYGFDPLAGAGPVALRPALTLKCRVVGVRDVAAGERVGYDGAHVCRRRSRLLLLPIGYADGLPRASWHGAPIAVRGRSLPVVGLVSMNQILVDATEAPEAGVGDEAVLLGRQGDVVLTPEARTPPGGSPYEVTSLLRPDLPRRWLGA